ncbi:hypothetical protein VTK73DRAFT_5199 [Phialemonium thermophilum]|uniref:Uncharacterized protein n=1 Tax=Phialemonium thermophilum TaxID=223376 RepID=A0ABR3V304_9PEZI
MGTVTRSRSTRALCRAKAGGRDRSFSSFCVRPPSAFGKQEIRMHGEQDIRMHGEQDIRMHGERRKENARCAGEERKSENGKRGGREREGGQRTGSRRPTSRNSRTVLRPRAKSSWSRSRASASSSSRRDRAYRSRRLGMLERRNDWKRVAMSGAVSMRAVRDGRAGRTGTTRQSASLRGAEGGVTGGMRLERGTHKDAARQRQPAAGEPRGMRGCRSWRGGEREYVCVRERGERQRERRKAERERDAETSFRRRQQEASKRSKRQT